MTVQTPIAVHPDAQTVTEVRHWTDTLFSFRVTRPRSLRFRSGEFAMIGLLKEDGKPLLRAYSIASPSWDDSLEFYSIKVPDGPLTSRLQHISEGDQVIVRPKVTGTLILDALTPAKRLWLLATGTGIAPFASILRDPDTYARYDQVILTHTCRTVAELAYGQELIEGLPDDPLIGEHVADKLLYYPSTTREPFLNQGRITDLMRSGQVFEDLNVPSLDPAADRVMICGSMGLNLEIKDILAELGFEEGSVNRPGDFVLEKAFVG
ncbi:ferredoxin--NADP+ reductase [Rubricella aquisinus]|uniref:ferredoxin--NADP(+) reductase n=1 Tax=Rubricella aquisinus TaxID=2028108 RepID=A0A840X1U1_9RHOB|nr:ferredoxin--NADP reductase [Rubricella aquisinus]MBB5515855.1 ferredoxin--NADP+ reductase [Rubricella aquisinus]